MTPRSIAAAISALIPIGISATAAQAPVPAGMIVTANMTASSVSLVDAVTGKTRATLPVSAAPHEVAISHDGRTAVVSIYGDRASVGNSLVVIDVGSAALVRTIDLGDYKRPHGMAFLPGDARLLVTSEATQKLLVVDIAKGAVDTIVAVGQPAMHMVALVPDGRSAYTTNIAANSVSAIDVATLKVRTTMPVGARIEGIAVTPDGREVWVGGKDGRHQRCGERAHRGRRRRDAGNSRHDRARRRDVTASVSMSPDGEFAFVTLKAVGQVAIVDLASGKIAGRITVGGGSDGVGFSPAR
ncbi:MAG: hypothetical protein M3081_19495 [Gemmatimonadota bacterium]|nr:hypothetical protein [Gemmatimonadota bacterium]